MIIRKKGIWLVRRNVYFKCLDRFIRTSIDWRAVPGGAYTDDLSILYIVLGLNQKIFLIVIGLLSVSLLVWLFVLGCAELTRDTQHREGNVYAHQTKYLYHFLIILGWHWEMNIYSFLKGMRTVLCLLILECSIKSLMG
ncbi:Uncharacterised protein [Weissella viridescens]|uniref:Uncharacterized protein n=1 Tax=Weissella viridescens TaxID=1629 RepID=A0A380P3R1_WEIVI|nr:Uncharacterised protein [Weissella viridescens]